VLERLGICLAHQALRPGAGKRLHVCDMPAGPSASRHLWTRHTCLPPLLSQQCGLRVGQQQQHQHQSSLRRIQQQRCVHAVLARCAASGGVEQQA
jgi:hypothetical protein